MSQLTCFDHRYFDVEEKYVFCTTERFVIDPKEAVDLVDENTIGICAIIGTTYTGEYEDVKAINDLLVEKGIDCPIHGKTENNCP
jgi:glutamate decarboxylase